MITPSEFKTDLTFDNREEEVYNFLKKKFADDKQVHVYHSLVINFPGVDHREIDFLVIGPFGLVILEIKNMNLRVNGKFLEKYSVNENKWIKIINEDKKYNNPIEQILTASDQLESFLKFNNKTKAPIESKTVQKFLVVLHPNVKSLQSPESKIIFLHEKNYQKSLSEILEKIDTKFTTAKINLICDILDKNCNYINSLNRRSKTHEQKIIALTKEQFKVLNELNDERILLEGVAGAGKTLIAMEAAKLADKNKFKTLLICHSSNLNAYLKDVLKEYKNITVSTMQGFLTNLEKIAVSQKIFPKTFHKSNNSTEKYDFVKNQKPKKILGIIDKIKNLDTFDYIIVDEAQDLLTENEMKILSKVLNGEFQKGKWLICYDGDQALMGPIESGLKYLQGFKPKYKNLKSNIRTPKEIFLTALKLAGLEKSNSKLDDYTTLEMIPYNSLEVGRKIINEFIFKAIKRGFKPEDITILSPQIKKNTEVIGNLMRLGDERKSFPLKLMNEGKIEKNIISFSEILRFKGMENKCIILTGIEDFKNEEIFNSIYVALTRSTHMALILYPKNAEKGLQERLGILRSKKK
jgi:superfamily I DNA and RNA helicase